MEFVNKNSLAVSIFFSALILAGTWIFTGGWDVHREPDWKELVLPSKGVVLPIRWDDLGFRLAEAGVIDREKFERLYDKRGGLSPDERELLEDKTKGRVTVMTADNADFLLNLFWAFGFGNKNSVLDSGPIQSQKTGGPETFASTGGWILASGDDPMVHFNVHEFIKLSNEQSALVERMAKKIHRPCCNNSTYFPDCNHGMAMLGLLELMAANGVSEKEMYKIALVVNAYWFPDEYQTIAKYLAASGKEWEKTDPKELLGANYSSSKGYRAILSKVEEISSSGGGSCGV